MKLRSIFILFGLLVLFPSYLSANVTEGSYKGTVQNAMGAMTHLQGEPCAVLINYGLQEKEAINVALTAGEEVFTGGPLSPSFTGANEYEPKYRVDWRSGQEVTEDQVVVLMMPNDTNMLKSVSAFKGDSSESAYEYSVTCAELIK